MIDAICREMEIQKNYLNGQTISSVYLGGGTPSILKPNELNQLFAQLQKYFNIDQAQEITIEANPDDMNVDLLSYLKMDSPVNRLSIGIQSFLEEELKYLESQGMSWLTRRYFTARLILSSPKQQAQNKEAQVTCDVCILPGLRIISRIANITFHKMHFIEAETAQC